MRPRMALTRCTVESICEDISAKVTLSDAAEERKLRVKLKHSLVRLLRRNAPLSKLGFPPRLWALLQKHLPPHRLYPAPRRHQLDDQENTPPGWTVEDDLIERSPIRSPRRSPDHPSHAPYRSFQHKDSQRVQETDTYLQAFCQELSLDEEMRKEFTEFCERFPDDNLAESDESSDSSYITNDCYLNNLKEWESAQCPIRSCELRQTRHSFSSSASTSSASPYPSPGPPLSSSPPSPASSHYSYDHAVHEITEGWLRTSVASEVPSEAGSSIPITVAGLSWEYPSSSPSASDDNVSERSYHELRSPQVREVVQASPETPMKKKLGLRLNAVEKENAWSRIQQLPLTKLASGDSEGDTQLMILLANKPPQQELYVYHIVERLLKESQSSLAATNRQGKDALRIAVEDCPEKPLLVGYLAEAYQRAAIPFKEYNESEETVVHVCVGVGDEGGGVLQQLVTQRWAGQPSFDVNKPDSGGLTPLHVAMAAHCPPTLPCYSVVRLLIRHGANLLAQDYLNRDTPLHVLIKNSADIKLIREIRAELEATGQLPLDANPVNRQGNTALHLACAKNSLPLPQHKMLVESLVSFGGRVHIKNVNGHVPSYLVEASRKEDMRPILKGKSACADDASGCKSTMSSSVNHAHFAELVHSGLTPLV